VIIRSGGWARNPLPILDFLCVTDLTVLRYVLFSIPVCMRAGWNRKKKKKKTHQSLISEGTFAIPAMEPKSDTDTERRNESIGDPLVESLTCRICKMTFNGPTPLNLHLKEKSTKRTRNATIKQASPRLNAKLPLNRSPMIGSFSIPQVRSPLLMSIAHASHL
jgi:hypothetical protein